VWRSVWACALGLAMAWAAVAQPAPPAGPAPVPAPLLVGADERGAVLDLAQLRGKVVLVVFWSTDCAVCLDKLPELRRNLAGWRGRPFEVVAVSQDRSAAELQAYLQALDRVAMRDPQMHIVWRRDANHRDGFGELPPRMISSFLIDRAGRVVKSVRGRIPPELWDEIAELVLN